MEREQQSAGEPFSERLRLIRFRMTKETFSFADEIRLIPRWLVVLVALLYVAVQAVGLAINLSGVRGEVWPEAYNKLIASFALAGVITLIAVPVAFMLFLIAYVNRDAARRGMNATLWTLLVIILMPAYIALGFIIYFLMREPLPFKCPHCGSTVTARFNYCPACKFNLRPTCPQCKREVAASDHYCPQCGYALIPRAANEAVQPVT